MIIGGAVTIILGIVALIPAFIFGGLLIAASIILLIGGIIELITGIIGIKNCAKPEGAQKCLVWGIITLVFTVISLILTFVVGQSSIGSILSTVVTGVAVPVLFIIGASLNKKAQ